ncbi:MAG: leucine--tRNA ligase, partial [Candidatus Aenigmarchaeota archaeon]|nr:leucine--tRNA ligase [Candidatus Aenigmarchaeota archaeon]
LDDAYLPAATLRPETVYGVTNIWLNPHADYVKIEVDGEKWIVAKEAVVKIKDQFKEVKILKEYDEKIELFGRRAKNPVTNMEMPIIPSEFVDPGNATGVVMSVPAHAPYDYIALEEFKAKNEEERFGIINSELEPISVVTSEIGEIPAKTVCERMKIVSTKQKKELDEATNVVYKKEFHTGILNESCGPYQGMKVNEVKDKIVQDFIEKEVSDIFYDVNNVVCRCTTKCHVKILENQWFLKYSDEEWKELVRKCLSKMNIYPEEARNNFLATLDWMKDKACTRKSGLGTQLPWDKSWIVETLSDSTIYMAYYTIAHIISRYKIPAKKLTDVVFDFIFLDKGDAKKIAKTSKINIRYLKAMKEEFEYFYPMDFRNSGKDLVQHHLLFFLYHHTAIWPEKYWPKCISVNGFVNVEGEKMSKSKGNIIPLRDLVNNYGADMVRINIATSSEGIDDADWRVENIKSFRMRYDFLFDLVTKMKKIKEKKMRSIDSYLLSKMQKIIKNATENFETTRFRTTINHALFDSTNELKWYLTRCNGVENANRKVLQDVLETIIKLLTPFTPHICEEMWVILGNKTFVSTEKWPKYSENMINESIEKGEGLIKNTLEDIREIQRIRKIKPGKVKIFVAEDWKFLVYNTILNNKGKTSTEVIRDIMATDLKKYGNATISFIQNLYKKINEINPVIAKQSQVKCLEEAKSFLEQEIVCKVEIINSDGSQDQKARSSSPQKLGILLE